MAAPVFVSEFLELSTIGAPSRPLGISIKFSTQDLSCFHRIEGLIHQINGTTGGGCSVTPFGDDVRIDQNFAVEAGFLSSPPYTSWEYINGSWVLVTYEALPLNPYARVIRDGPAALCFSNSGMLVGERVRITPMEPQGFGGWLFPPNDGASILATVTSVNRLTGQFGIDYECFADYTNPRVENRRGPFFYRMDYPNAFEVQARRDGGDWKPLVQQSRCYNAGDPTFTVKHLGLLSGVYEYRVRAISETGDPGAWSAISDPVTITTDHYVTPYDAVTDLAVTSDPDTHQPVISWTIPPDAATVYPLLIELQRSIDFGETWQVVIAQPALPSPYTDNDIPLNYTVQYRLRYSTHAPSFGQNALTPPYDSDIYDTNNDGFVDWRDLRRIFYAEGDTAVTEQDPDSTTPERRGYPDGPIVGPGPDAMLNYLQYVWTADIKGRSDWSNVVSLPGRPFAQHLFFPNFADSRVESMQYDGFARQNITGRWLPEAERPRHTALGRHDGGIYFTTHNENTGLYSLWRVGFDGVYNDTEATRLKTFASGEEPTFLAVDAANNRLWWIENSTNSIYLASLTAGGAAAIVSSETNPITGLCWAGVSGKLYYYDSTAGDLKRCDADGSNLETVVNYATLPALHALCVDETAGFLYASAPEHGRLWRIRLSTWARTALRTGLENIYAVACDAELGRTYYCHGDLSGQKLSYYTNGAASDPVIKQFTMPAPETMELFYSPVHQRPSTPGTPFPTHLANGQVRLFWQLSAPPGQPFTTPPDSRYQICELFRSDDGWETEVPLGWVLPRFRPEDSPSGWFFFFKDVDYIAGAQYAVRVIRSDWRPPTNLYYGDWRTRLNSYGWTNAVHRLDVNDDGWVNGLDLLELSKWLDNRTPPGPPQPHADGDPYLQTTGGAVYYPDSITVHDVSPLLDALVYPPSLPTAKVSIPAPPAPDINPDDSTKVTETCPEVSWWGDTGTVYRSNIAYLGRSLLPPADGNFENVALRFTLNVDNAETITGAYLRFRAQGDSTGVGVKLRIFAELAEDAAAITDYASAAASAAAPTTAEALWENLGDWLNGQYYDSVDISEIIQELVDQAGFVSGNHVVLHIVNNNPTGTSARQAVAADPCESHNNPRLVTFHFTGATTTIPPTTTPPTTSPPVNYEILGPEACDALYTANWRTSSPRISVFTPDGDREEEIGGFTPDMVRVDHASGKLYVITANPRTLTRCNFDASGATVIATFTASEVVTSFAVDSDRNVAYAVTQNTVFRINLTTGVKTVFASYTVFYNRSVGVDTSNGDLYLAHTGAGRIDLEVYNSSGVLLRSTTVVGLFRILSVEWSVGRVYLVLSQPGASISAISLASVRTSDLLNLRIHATSRSGATATDPLDYFYPTAVDAQRGFGYFISLAKPGQTAQRNRIVAKVEFATGAVTYLTESVPGALAVVPPGSTPDNFRLDGSDFCFNPVPTTAPPTTVPPTTAPPTTGPPTTEPPTTAPPVIGCGHVWVADRTLGVMRYTLPAFSPLAQLYPTESQQVVAIDIDSTLEKVYWANAGDGRVYSGDFHGLFAAVELHAGEEAIRGLAFESTNTRVFFTEEKTDGTHDFNRVDTDGSNLTSLITASAVACLGVAANNTTAKVAVGLAATTSFDSDGSISIYDAGAGTLDINTTPTLGLTRPVGLCFDEANNHLYVADATRRRIWRYDVGGDAWTLVRTGASLSESPHGLDWDVNLNRLWWAEPFLWRVRSSEPDGSVIYTEQVFDTTDRPFDLRICDVGGLITTAPPTTEPPTTPPPTTGPPTTEPPTTAPPTTAPPIAATAQYLAWTDVANFEINACNEDGSVVSNVYADSVFFLTNSSGLTYSRHNDRYYWVNWRRSLIASCRPNGDDLQVHSSGDLARGLGLYAHRATEQLFVVDNQHRTVSVLPLEGTNTPQILLSDLRSPLDVVVGGDRLYISDERFILSCDLDGGSARVEAEFSYTPYGLAWDDSEEELYYVVPGPLGAIRKRRIADGFDIKLADASNAVKIVLDVDANKMFWSEPINNRIRQATMSGATITDIYSETGATPNWLAIYPEAAVATPAAPTTAPPTTSPPVTTSPPTTTPPTTSPPVTTAPPTTAPPTTRAPILVTRRGREQLVVDQAPYAGTYYPFIRPSHNLEYLIGDIFVLLPPETYAHPLRISRLENFDEGSSAEYRIQIRDAADVLVLDTNNLTKTGQSNWGDTKVVVEWADEEAQRLLRVVVFIARDARDEAFVFSSLIEPTDGRLDARTIEYVEPVVREIEIRPESGPPIVLSEQKNVVLTGGYNMALNVAPAVVGDGSPHTREIEFDATPGGGFGLFPGCDEEVLLQSINGVVPDAAGNIRIELEHAEAECYRLERTNDPEGEATSGNSSEFPGVSVTPASLTFTNNCTPCCKCEDFVNVYRAIRRLYNLYRRLGQRAEAVRDQLAINNARFEAQRECRRKTLARTVLTQLPGCRVGVAGALCNNQDIPIRGFTLRFDFSESTISGDSKCVRCDSMFRRGNVDETKSIPPTRYTAYKLRGSWPVYEADFDCISSADNGYVTFQLEFPDGGDGDQVSLKLSVLGNNPGEAQVVQERVALKCTYSYDESCCETLEAETTSAPNTSGNVLTLSRHGTTGLLLMTSDTALSVSSGDLIRITGTTLPSYNVVSSVIAQLGPTLVVLNRVWVGNSASGSWVQL